MRISDWSSDVCSSDLMQGIGMLDIPLTHRGTSEGVWMLTGMKSDGSIASDLSLAVQSNSTVVIYMGMRNLSAIVRTYVMHGKGENGRASCRERVCKYV